MFEKLQALTEEQKQELSALTTAEEVLAFAKGKGIDLTPEEAAKIVAALPDDALGGIAGGSSTFTQCDSCWRVGPRYLKCDCGGRFGY